MQPADFLMDIYKPAAKEEINYSYIIAIVLVILVLGGWWYFNMKKKQLDTSPSSPIAAPVFETFASEPVVKRWALEPHV